MANKQALTMRDHEVAAGAMAKYQHQMEGVENTQEWRDQCEKERWSWLEQMPPLLSHRTAAENDPEYQDLERNPPEHAEEGVRKLEALMARHAKGPTRKLVTLEVQSTTAPAHPGASLMQNNRVVGTVTSGDWGHRVGKNLAYAFVEPDMSAPGSATHIDILGDLIQATVIEAGPYERQF